MKERNLVGMTLLLIFTFGFYQLYWFWKTKNEMNKELRTNIPTAWLLWIPIANLYWIYKYCEVFSNKVKRDKSPILWFLLFIFIPVVPPLLVQSEFNRLAKR